jgi:diguanylate cyclase (GGDEF)-like protein
MILNNKGYYKKGKLLALLSFVLFPLLGLLIQVIYFGVTLVWNFTTISIIFIYLKIQIKENTIDYLTELNTRGSFDNHINGWIKKAHSGTGFAMIMIDIDHFKAINDKLGHKEGDRALIVFSEALRKFLRSDDFIARYGGDEFVVLVDFTREDQILDVIKRIKDELRLLNANKVYKFELDFSYGYSFFKDSDAIDTDHFVDYVDKLMYKQKQSKCTM